MSKKIIIAMALAATAAAVTSANAAPRGSIANAELFHALPGATIRLGDACWKQTDGGRGFGYWTACNNHVPYAQAAGQYMPAELYGGGGSDGGGESGGGGDSGGGDGGGGGEGGGGGGGGGR